MEIDEYIHEQTFNMKSVCLLYLYPPLFDDFVVAFIRQSINAVKVNKHKLSNVSRKVICILITPEIF